MAETRRRLRIVNDGKPGWATTITDTTTGQPMLDVSSIDLHIDARNLPDVEISTLIARVTAVLPAIDLTVDADITHTCPYCGHTEKPMDREAQALYDRLLSVRPDTSEEAA